MLPVLMCPDVEALSRLGMSTSDQNAEVTLPRQESTAESTEEGTDGEGNLDSVQLLLLV